MTNTDRSCLCRVAGWVLLAACVAALGVSDASAAVIYRENFYWVGNNPSAYGWNANARPTAIDITVSPNVWVNVSGNSSVGTAKTPINSNNSSSGLPGYSGQLNVPAGEPELFWTDEFSFPGKAVALTQALWTQFNTSTTQMQQVAVRVGNDWYATDQRATNTGVPDGTLGTVAALDLTTATWSSVAFTPNSTLAVGSPVGALPRGTITAFGYFESSFPGGGMPWRMDNFELSGEERGPAADEVVFYREVVPYSGSSNLASIDWVVHSGNTAVPTGSVGPNPGGAQKLAVNSGYSGTAPVNGYAGGTGTTDDPMLFWTDEYAIAPAFTLTEARWVKLTNATHNFNLAVRVGNNDWYVTDQSGANTPLTEAAGVNTFNLVSLDLETATWSTLNFTPGSMLSVGASVSALPYGSITAYGLYERSYEGTILRFDNFTLIGVVPEPGTWILLALGAVGLWGSARRRPGRQRP